MSTSLDGKTGRRLLTFGRGEVEYDNTCFGFLSRSIALYRPPAVRFNGMSYGIGASRSADRYAEQRVERLGNDRVGVTG